MKKEAQFLKILYFADRNKLEQTFRYQNLLIPTSIYKLLIFRIAHENSVYTNHCLYVLVMSRTRLRVNPHSTVA